MSHNVTESNMVKGNMQNEPQDVQNNSSDESVTFKLARSISTVFTHICIGVVVGSAILFAFRNGTPLNATNLHLLLCVIGYQLLMAEAIISLSPASWLSNLKLRHKRLVHMIVQIIGSLMVIAGSFIKIADKEIHWNTLHGQFGLVALVFTSVSLVNGLTSFYANKFHRFIPGALSKLTHICFGIVSLSAASICLSYGFDKNFFRNWATSNLADTLIVLTLVFTIIVIISPFITFFKRLKGHFRK
ncbi:unnamed protein product [Diatraea saccharalis]|uniref:ascorbate ferrireductase (transmembrane) n=1 Tax=Diatraea saccharalis TaxID=40085 RepID=A0A9N9R2C2_9NEOP|nr:unnamed protein product [Diatraea saccharalis]